MRGARSLLLAALALAGCDYQRLSPSDLDAPTSDAVDPDGVGSPDAMDGGGIDAAGPQLASTEIPLRIAVSTTVTVRLTVQGMASQQIMWSIATGGGGFVPSSGTITLSGSGIAVIATQYSAPAAASDYNHTLTLNDGTAHQLSFTTRVRTPAPIGNATTFPDSGGLQVSAGYLFGQQLTVASQVVVLRMGMFSDNGSASGRLALYTSVANLPSMLVANTAVSTITTGQTELDVVAPVVLDPGTYWIMGNFVAGTQVRRAPGDVAQAYVAQQVADPLPTTIASPMTTTGRGLNFYAMVAP